MSNRPTSRSLVRWNDDHDKELLMWVVYCCGEQGIKLPFARVAQCMGAKFTEGAIVQHLAKIRTKMDENGLHVPPAQKRGTVTRTGSSIYRPKPKSLNDPVPRVRPDTSSPPPRSHRGSLDEEDMHADELVKAPSRRRTGTKSVSRPPRSRKSSAVVKHDSEEDEPLPALFDSDDEYATQMSTSAPAKNAIAREVQLKLNFSGKPGAPTGNTQSPGIGVDASISRSSSTIPSQHSPSVKRESIEISNDAHQALPHRQGTRRKSSAMRFDNDDEADDDYRPGLENHSPSKKTKVSRKAKKPKIDKKEKNRLSKDKESAAIAEYQEASTYDADRAAMPPPSFPLTNTRNDVTWNANFMSGPFVPQPAQQDEFNQPNINEGAWNDFSPTYVSQQSTQMPYMGGSGMRNFNPHFNYYAQGVAQDYSAADSRNHSFASAGSTSTIESQPMSWNQPVRSPGFPNPREASRVLHEAVHTPGADSSTLIDIFQSPTQDQPMPISWSESAQHDHLNADSTQQAVADISDSDYMFVGRPEFEPVEDDSLMDMFLNEEAYGNFE